MAGINRSEFVWVGPSNYKEDFAARFYKGLACSGDIFFQAEDSARLAEYTSIAKARKFQVNEDIMMGLSNDKVLEMVLPPGALVRVFEHMQTRSSMEDVLIADVEQNVGRGAGGSEWPVQLTHGTFMHITDDIATTKLATSFEHMIAMGWNIYAREGSLPPRSSTASILENGTFSRREIKMMAGNSMHVVTQAAWMVYVLSNIVRRPEPKASRGLTRRLQTFDHIDEEDSDDVE